MDSPCIEVKVSRPRKETIVLSDEAKILITCYFRRSNGNKALTCHLFKINTKILNEVLEENIKIYDKDFQILDRVVLNKGPEWKSQVKAHYMRYKNKDLTCQRFNIDIYKLEYILWD